MNKAYRVSLYFDDKLKILIHKTFGCVIFVYNHFLRDCMGNGYRKSYDMCKELQDENIFLKEIDSCILDWVLLTYNFMYKK